MGPLAMMAKNAGYEVLGSDLQEGAVTHELREAGIELEIGAQDGSFLRQKNDEAKIDWFVYTSALPKDHKELVAAQKLGIKCSKRDEFIEFLTTKLGLKMIAVAGTHGKTTTTAGIIFLLSRLGVKISWLVGTTLGFAEAGKYEPESEYIIYEADEYDRNFLYYHPKISVIPSVSYDHPDIYPTREDYLAAFEQFKAQSEEVIEKTELAPRINIAGAARRFDLALGIEAVRRILPEQKVEEMIKIMDKFPGVGRRMEKIAPGVY